MNRLTCFLLASFVLALAATLYGCSEAKQEAAPAAELADLRRPSVNIDEPRDAQAPIEKARVALDQIAWQSLDPAVASVVQEMRAEAEASVEPSGGWGKLGMMLLAHDLFEPAARCLLVAASGDRDEPRWPYFAGMALRDIDPTLASEQFRQASDRFQPARIEPDLRRAELLMGQQQTAEAWEPLQRVLAVEPKHDGANLAAAQLCLLEGRLRDCIKHLQDAGIEDRPSRKALLLASEAYRRLNVPDAAERHRVTAERTVDRRWHDSLYDEVLQLRIGLRTRLETIDRLYLQNRIDESVQLAEVLVREYPDSEWARILWARGLIRQRQLVRAEQVLIDTLAINPDSFEAHFRLGVAKQLAGQHDQACQWFEKTLKIQPSSAVTHKNLAVSRLMLREIAAAEHHLKEAVRVQPNYFDGHWALAEFYAGQRKPQEAREALLAAQKIAPEDPRVRAALANIK